MATAAVCDDDGVLRSAVTAICESVGLDVVAETDGGVAVLDLIQRFTVDVVVLDQALPDLSGEHVLRALQEADHRPEVVIFSAYATDPYHLIELGARDVVDKPDFERLEQVLEGVVLSLAATPELARQERRSTRRRVVATPTVARPRDGFATESDLLATAAHTVVGDSVLVVALADADASSRTRLAALLHDTLRAQDVLHGRPDPGGFVAVLRGGDAHAPGSVWRRLVAAATEAGLPDRLHGAWRQVDELGMLAAVERAEDAVVAALEGTPGLQPA